MNNGERKKCEIEARKQELEARKRDIEEAVNLLKK